MNSGNAATYIFFPGTASRIHAIRSDMTCPDGRGLDDFDRPAAFDRVMQVAQEFFHAFALGRAARNGRNLGPEAAEQRRRNPWCNNANGMEPPNET